MRTGALAAAVGCAALLALAPPADAVTCANLQAAIGSVTNGGTVTVNHGTCTGMSFTLPPRPATFTFAIQGAGSGATFNGGAAGNRILTGTDVGVVTLRNLTFENSTGPASSNGGAVDIEGNSGVTLDNDRFLGNKITGGFANGGAVSVKSTSSSPTVIRNSTFGGTTSTSGNSAQNAGGGLSLDNTGTGNVQISHSVFRRNSAGIGGGLAVQVHPSSGNPTATLTDSSLTQNSAASEGGAALVASKHSMTVQRNVFGHNSIVSTQDGAARAGGLWVVATAPLAPIAQTGNRFDGNHIGQDGSRSTFAPAGGGEWAQGVDLTSRSDHFTNNSLAAAVGTGNEAEGGGLGLEGCGISGTPTDVLTNMVAAGNQIAGEGHGAAVYGGGCGGGTVNAIVLDSTIAGNHQGSAAGSGGLAGGSGDTLKMRNSIVTGNGIGADVESFATRTITNTDACASGAPVSGSGNICKAPMLANPGPGHADVHETTKSPTINAGSNVFVPGGLTTDFEGQARIQNKVVDMGADEFKDRFRGVAVVAKTARVKSGEARVKVRCPKTAVGQCTGKLTLRSHGHEIGSQTFVIGSGKERTVKVPLTHAAKSELQQVGALDHVLARTKAHDHLGTRKRTSRSIDLKPAG